MHRADRCRARFARSSRSAVGPRRSRASRLREHGHRPRATAARRRRSMRGSLPRPRCHDGGAGPVRADARAGGGRHVPEPHRSRAPTRRPPGRLPTSRTPDPGASSRRRAGGRRGGRRRSGADLDVLVVRKLGVPGNPEFAMGAVGEDDVIIVDHAIRRQAHVTERAGRGDRRAEQRQEIARRVETYRGEPRPARGRRAQRHRRRRRPGDRLDGGGGRRGRPAPRRRPRDAGGARRLRAGGAVAEHDGGRRRLPPDPGAVLRRGAALRRLRPGQRRPGHAHPACAPTPRNRADPVPRSTRTSSSPSTE